MAGCKPHKSYVHPLRGLTLRENTMNNYEAIKNLTSEQLEKFLDQVFLTGFNTGYQSLVDPDIHDGNPFDTDWLNADVDEAHTLVEDEAGERLIIEPLVSVIKRIVEFDADSIPGDISWQMQVVLPKGIDENDENGKSHESE